MAAGEKVLESTDLAYDDTLNLFSLPLSNMGVTDVKYLQHKPINQFSVEGDVKFHVTGAGTSYIDLSSVYIKTSVRIVKADGSLVPERPKQESPIEGRAASETPAGATSDGDADEWSVGPVNYLSHALWDQVEVRLNDRVVTGGQTGYSYKALINTLLDDNEITDSQLECALFIKDTGKAMDDVSLLYGSNKGYNRRAALMDGSKTIELLGKVDVDVFKVNKLLLNGVSLDMTLTPTSSHFRLMSTNRGKVEYRLEIRDITLVLKHTTPSNLILLAHQKVLEEEISMAKYFYTKEELRKFSIGAGAQSYYIEDIYNGKIPSKIVLGFIAGTAMNGRLDRNPYNFMNYDVTYINVSLSGMPTPNGPINVDFKEGKYIQCYSDLYQGKENFTSKARITRDDYKDGYSLFSINLAPQNYDEFYPVSRDGCVRIELRFKKPLPETIVMLTKVTYPGLFQIDYARNIYLT